MIYILSDIHGHARRVESMLRQLSLGKEDRLYVLGDCIDRNPDGLRILLELHNSPNTTVLLGNHEHMMLEALTKPDPDGAFIGRWYRNGGNITHDDFNRRSAPEQREILSIIRSLPVNIPLHCGGRDFLLVHGAPVGWQNKYDDPVKDSVWARFTREDAMPAGPTVIFGHTPTNHYQDDVPMRIWHGTNMIGIDCGCAYETGRLACLRLDDMREFYAD